MTALYITLAAITGLIAGVVLNQVTSKNRVAKHKKELRSKNRIRQRKLLEHMRIEVKNNTIRLKKEEKRLALSKELSELELLFKNYKQRLYKVKDKELLSTIQDFYAAVLGISFNNDKLISFREKSIEGYQELSDDVKIQLKNAMATSMLTQLQETIESGNSLVELIEDTIQKT